MIFDVQNPAHLDRNIISKADLILIKEPGPLTQGFERPQLRPTMDNARASFSPLSENRKTRALWAVAPRSEIQGKLMENLLPSFWTGSLSPNPPKDTDGRREDSGRGWVRELQGRWPGVLG